MVLPDELAKANRRKTAILLVLVFLTLAALTWVIGTIWLGSPFVAAPIAVVVAGAYILVTSSFSVHSSSLAPATAVMDRFAGGGASCGIRPTSSFPTASPDTTPYVNHHPHELDSAARTNRYVTTTAASIESEYAGPWSRS